jgi:methylisocitrate lyase
MNNTKLTAGFLFRQALKQERPLQVIGTINAYHAKLAEKTGYKAIYLSGGGVAAGSLGMPDLGMSTLEDVLIDIRRITDITALPMLVDIDTGFGGALNIARTIRAVEKAGAAAVHIEDQVQAKRCGHRPNKAVVSQAEMVDRIKSAVDAKQDNNFVIMARTDALAVEGLESAIDRACACVNAGADMIFPEAINDLATYKKFTDAVDVPVLANITEFGATPLFTIAELKSVNIAIALYPLSAFRAMNKAALNIYQSVRKNGTQREVVDQMQTREELYDYLDYHTYEQRLDQFFSQEKKQKE